MAEKIYGAINAAMAEIGAIGKDKKINHKALCTVGLMM